MEAFVKMWQELGSRTGAVMCSQHWNIPDGCFHLHYPTAQRSKQ